MVKPAVKMLRAVRSKLRGWGAAGDSESLRMEKIRRAMLRCLDAEIKRHFPKLERRVVRAASVSELWFLRPELLMAMANRGGEEAAQKRMRDISRLFDGLLPSSMNARPSFQVR